MNPTFKVADTFFMMTDGRVLTPSFPPPPPPLICLTKYMTLLAGYQWWPFFVTFYFLVTDILCLVIQYFGSIN